MEHGILFVLWRAVSEGPAARALEKAITPLIAVGLIAAIVGYVVGFLIWPVSALTASPAGRNHLLLATWTVAYWAVLLLVLLRLGDAAWAGGSRWLTVILTAIGAGFLLLTGTVGGSLAHRPSGFSDLVGALGWDTHTTLYAPTGVLVFTVAAAAALAGLAVWGRRTGG